MPLLLLLLLLLLFISTSLQHSDKFVFHGFLRCSFQKEWCWKVEGIESDYPEQDTFFGVDQKCTSMQSAEYKVTGELNGDGVFDDEYELGLAITHSCTRNGETTSVYRQSLWSVPVGADNPYYFEKNFVLPITEN